jgi:hypothetical protein
MAAVVEGYFWVDAKAPGTLAHTVRGTLEPGVLKVHRSLCGIVRSGIGVADVPADRQCPRCVDVLVDEERRRVTPQPKRKR